MHGYHFFKRKSLVRAFQPTLTSRVVYLNRRCQQYHFLKIQGSVLRKITIDLLYFRDVCDVIL